ncbi:DUF4192 family protein [Nocardia sp. NPDC052566]|uniref:DUF4192 family protein n=1 Tax=Nocardia sp. NPDC052566 TaxID=3364330 RepID=UPI0037C8E92C
MSTTSVASVEPTPLAEPSVDLPLDPGLSRHFTQCLAEHAEQDREVAATGDDADTKAARRERLRFVLTQIHAADTGAELPAPILAQVVVVLRDNSIRYCFYTLSTGPRARICQRFWTRLVTAIPAPQRAQTAMLLAVTAYTGGDTALATRRSGSR